MKFVNIVIVVLLLLESPLMIAQVGVNTDSPQGVFHVDPLNNTSGATNNMDDVIITAGGKMGIGTSSPTANLHIIGSLKIDDVVSTGVNKLLTSDATGKGVWGIKVLGSKVDGVNADAILPAFNISKVSKYSGVSITLPTGAWQITFIATYRNALNYAVNIDWDLSTSSTVNTMEGHDFSYCALPGFYLPVVAVNFVEHTSPTTYYVWGGGTNFPATGSVQYSGEGKIWAIPVQ